MRYLRLAPAEERVITVDALTDGIDFRLDEMDPRSSAENAWQSI